MELHRNGRLDVEFLQHATEAANKVSRITAFVKRTLRLDAGGRTIRSVKEQLNRLAAADFRLYAKHDHGAITVKGTVIGRL